MSVNKVVSGPWYFRGRNDRNAPYDSSVAISYYSINESALCSALRLTDALYQHCRCTSKQKLLGTDPTGDAVLFKAFAALPLEGQPTSPRLVLLHRFFFQIPQLWPGMHSPCTLPARCFFADECGGAICKHCCVFWWWMCASCLHSVSHLSPQPLQDQLLL